MNILADYTINEKTVLLTGEYDPFGNLCTRVIEGEKTFLVKMKPIALIDKTLLQQGCNLKGALESSRFLLGPIKMVPIKVNPTLDIWLFPSKSYKMDNCVWFALSHIQKAKAIGLRKTDVALSFGHHITIEMKESSFAMKRQHAVDLKEIILKNSNHPLTFSIDQKPGFFICEDKKVLRLTDRRQKTIE